MTEAWVVYYPQDPPFGVFSSKERAETFKATLDEGHACEVGCWETDSPDQGQGDLT